MNFILASTFQTAMVKLSNDEQKAVKLTVFDLQRDPANPGFQFHRIYKSKDQNFWSVRVNRDIRLIVHKTQSSFLVAYVDHHDAAYKWAERRRIDAHPRTGAAQIVEVRERVEEVTIPAYVQAENTKSIETDEQQSRLLFLNLTDDDLLGVGVPEDWLNDIRNASEDNFLDLADHIPSEAAEALLEYAATGNLVASPSTAQQDGDPFAHPDAIRHFCAMENPEDLEQALNYPWDKWAIYLHPDQKAIVEAACSGPTRITGPAGTGKTVVALHRARKIYEGNKEAKILLTTFSPPLSNALDHKLRLLMKGDSNFDYRVSVGHFEGVAKELFTLIHGHDPKIARHEHVVAALSKASSEFDVEGFSDRFLLSEWHNVIDAWQIGNLEDYARVPRLGRKKTFSNKQRAKLWPIFERAQKILASQLRYTPATVFGEVAAYYKSSDTKPFSHIIIDESQDLGVPALKMIAAIAFDGPEALFFVGDLGQRIFQEPFSWLGLGIDVRGRSHTLKINYRTSHQIQQAADRLLPQIISDVDGIEEDRRGYVSIFNGTNPDILVHASAEEEIKEIGLVISEAISGGILPEDIGVFVRSEKEITRVREAVKRACLSPLELSSRIESRTGKVVIGTMHSAKGLEFRKVIVMACDEYILPDQNRVNTVSTEIELDEVYETERHLFYVACTRAREHLTISGVSPASEFFADFE